MTYPFSTPNRVTKYEVIEEVPRRTMVIFAHPDDAEIGAGATAALWAANGTEITYVQCTTGSSGSNDLARFQTESWKFERPNRGQRPMRSESATSWCLITRTASLMQTVYSSARSFMSSESIARRSFSLTTRTGTNGFQHRDHRSVGITVQNAIYPYAQDHLHFPEQLTGGIEPYKVKHLFYWGTDQADVIVDVTDSVDTKIKALAQHKSQIPGLSFGSDMDLRMRAHHADAAKGYGFEYGEAFRRLTART